MSWSIKHHTDTQSNPHNGSPACLTRAHSGNMGGAVARPGWHGAVLRRVQELCKCGRLPQTASKHSCQVCKVRVAHQSLPGWEYLLEYNHRRRGHNMHKVCATLLSRLCKKHTFGSWRSQCKGKSLLCKGRVSRLALPGWECAQEHNPHM